eukprot:38446-Rhodomonas_salina.1
MSPGKVCANTWKIAPSPERSTIAFRDATGTVTMFEKNTPNSLLALEAAGRPIAVDFKWVRGCLTTEGEPKAVARDESQKHEITVYVS